MKEEQLIKQFQQIEDNFNTAVISNSVDEIKKCVTRDWVLQQGQLSHSTMTKVILRVKVYGDIALVTGRGQNTGTWQGRPLEADEWITDVYKNENDKWLCVLTHLTPVKK